MEEKKILLYFKIYERVTAARSDINTGPEGSVAPVPEPVLPLRD